MEPISTLIFISVAAKQVTATLGAVSRSGTSYTVAQRLSGGDYIPLCWHFCFSSMILPPQKKSNQERQIKNVNCVRVDKGIWRSVLYVKGLLEKNIPRTTNKSLTLGSAQQ